MDSPLSKQAVFRFAPSPNGLLHLGHAYSAILNRNMAAACDGRLLLRIEDIDTVRCRPEYEDAIYRDLHWLGIDWERPVRRQSDHFPFYQHALEDLIGRGLAYPAFLSRGEVRERVAASEASGRPWPRDPDGAPCYPIEQRDLDPALARQWIEDGRQHAWRLNMDAAIAAAEARLGDHPLQWQETGAGPEGETGQVMAQPQRWGDVILSRPDAPSSYHLSVSLDDAAQHVTHVVRGQDLFHATSVHRLLQVLLGLPQPVYRHHGLVLGEDGRKLSKSNRDTGIAAYREKGLLPADLCLLLARDGLVLD
ncbi:tRNA glutamyl-Q(34) synthetase GluQRS [Mycoplana rhizolycopersici]|uniref:tRNA glutamyl-Q(34) synthetase GluQRS n=1 Tax=Mycoplana rhizolycopersici TaxID=2746702 RepID=A0ABX2Q7H0_9HYPH|nr:tRNA glutamyl-Q(34) synthetase GluQRS [Rhizobium rhizolycopersici]NVP53661.1 tRNA glutamyl-Q(34) synthetase GluQRS [Rhizobium rhizolycopersici]